MGQKIYSENISLWRNKFINNLLSKQVWVIILFGLTIGWLTVIFPIELVLICTSLTAIIFAINKYKTCFLLLLFFLPFSGYLTFEFQGGTVFPHDIAIPALFFVWVFNGLIVKRTSITYSKNDTPVIVYFLLCFLSLLYALLRFSSAPIAIDKILFLKAYLNQIRVVGELIMFFLIARNILKLDDLFKIIKIMIAVCIIESIIIIFQFLGMGGSLFSTTTHGGAGSLRFGGTLGVGGIAIILQILIPIVMVLLLMKEEAGINKGYLRLYLFLFTVALLLTQTRTAWVAVVISTFIISYFYRKLWLIWLMGVVAGIYMIPFGRARLLSILDPRLAYYVVDRLAIWAEGLRLYFGNLLLGVGKGNFGFFSRFYGVFGINYAHNQYLTIAAEMGTVGLIVFMWFIVRVVRVGWSNFRTLGGQYKVLSLGLFAIILAIYVSCLGGEFIFPQTPKAIIPGLYVWLVIVFIFKLNERKKFVNLTEID